MYKGIIYKYTSPSGKHYIGQTSRKNGRISDFNNSNISYGGSRIDKARIKYGVSSFSYEVLAEVVCDTRVELSNELDRLEIFYIDKYDSYKKGYNMTIGGSGNVGYVYTEEVRKCISESNKRWISEKGHPMSGRKHRHDSILKMKNNTRRKFGSDNPMFGRKHTEEAKSLLSRLSKGRTGDKNPFYGKKHSKETIYNISKALSKPIVMIDKDSDEILMEFTSAKEAARFLGKPKSNSEIAKVCNEYVSPKGKRYVTCLGYKWRYKDEGSSTIESTLSKK